MSKRRPTRATANSVNSSPAATTPFDAELLAALGLDALIPAPLAHWRTLVSDGLTFFLTRLPAERVATIITEQLVLGIDPDADAACRLVALMARCPTLHKLGQIVARHPQLDENLRRQLQKLESLPATTPHELVLARIRHELENSSVIADTQAAHIEIGSEALAEGSVAVVMPFTWRQGDEVQHGVFKVLKPGIEDMLAQELAILVELAPYLEERSRALVLPPVDYRDMLETVQRLMTREVHLDIEQQNLRAAAAFYAEEPLIQVPDLLPWCTPRMTAMERIFGTKVTDAELTPVLRQQLAETMISALLGQPFWSTDDRAVVHADLHAGNLFVTADGRLAVLDWSLTAGLTKTQREALVAIVLGGLLLDADSIRRAVATLGTITHDDPILSAAVERALDQVAFQGHRPGFDWLLALFDELALHTAAGFWEDFVLLRKSWLSLSGVIGDLAGSGVISPDPQLIGLALQRFLTEMPSRPLAQAGAQHFASHVSNADLLRLSASPWLISLRWWDRCTRQTWGWLGVSR